MKEITANDLSAAVDALGEIMNVLAGRRLLARGIKNDVIRNKIEADLKTDAQLEEIAARAFEAGAMALALAKHPGATMHVCNPTEEP